MSIDALIEFSPSDRPLLDLVFSRVDDSMLREIAEADYGRDAEAHLEALVAIRDRGHFPAPMEWHPQEVLELIRFSELDDPTRKPGSAEARSQWLRLFSCGVLLRSGAEPENKDRFGGEESTIIQFVDSALALGRETSLAAIKFLCWCLRCRIHYESQRPPYAVAILLLYMSLGEFRPQTIQYLMRVARSDDEGILNAFLLCTMAEKWRDFTREILIKSTGSTLSAELKEFGFELIGKFENKLWPHE